jgi:hypothetical protein
MVAGIVHSSPSAIFLIVPRRILPERVLPNLQVINRAGHVAKCADEAGLRARSASEAAPEQPAG